MESEELKNRVIDHYQNELNKYKDQVGPGLKRLLDEERTPYLKSLNALYDVYMFQNYLLDNQAEYFNKPGNQTLSLFFTKAAGDIFALRQCLMVGQLVSASSIERNIFETYVNTRLVLEKDSEARFQLYEEYQHALLWERVRAFKNYLQELESDETIPSEKLNSEKEYFQNLYKDIDMEVIETNYQKVKENYHPKKPHHWAWKVYKDVNKGNNPTLGFICKKLGIYNDYLHVYSTSSLAVHNQPLLANMMTRKGGITSVPIFTETTNSIAGISTSLVTEIIMMILEYAGSNKLDEMGLFLNNLFKESFIDE